MDTQKNMHRNVYVIDEKGEGATKRSFWTKVGVGFENRDGSFSIELSALPVKGRLHMRLANPKDRSDSAM